jgi:hypothetical protein
MPCLRRPGCPDSISSFDSAGVVHNNVYSTEIVQVGSKSQESLYLNLGKDSMDTPVSADLTIRGS